MINADFLKQLTESTAKASAELSKSMGIIDKMMEETLKNAPEEDKAEINRLKNLSMQVVNYAKAGDTKKVEELINTFKNGSKGN